MLASIVKASGNFTRWVVKILLRLGYSEDTLYWFFIRIFWWVLGDRLDLEVVGTENIPKSGPRLMIFNHVNVLDVFTLPMAIPLVMHAWVANRHIDIPFMAAFHAINRAHPIKRGKSDKAALLWGVNVLRSEEIMTLAPGGTRSETGILVPKAKVKWGFAYLADKTDATIIPVGINGTVNGLKKIMNPFTPKVKVRIVIGKKFKLSEFEDPPSSVKLDDDDKGRLQGLAVKMMYRIAELLDEPMRGEYK
jgi:1-acyl-sn-glycerol-3-phosphate acyltransferase